MLKALVAGAGTIGSLIAILLVNSKDYEVFLIDNQISHLNLRATDNLHLDKLDVTDSQKLKNYLEVNKIEVVISSLPYFNNLYVAKMAAWLNLNYFDLTEDVGVVTKVRGLAEGKKSAFVSQCGVAPGFINIVANHLISYFDQVEGAYLRAGCLPKSSNNALHYAITWSIDGVINEYGNVCYGLANSRKTEFAPLEDLETVELDGNLYEAFNTSGGVGSLVDTFEDKIKHLNYKTLRYPGHCEKMRFLMNDLQLNDDREILKKILERSLPRTDQDVMLIYVSVSGQKAGSYIEKSYIKKIEPALLYDKTWSAIQVSTASSICAVVDLVLGNSSCYQGFILQEQLSYVDFLKNRFGRIYAF
jgi:saccharopine dehydrogenase-like NADP-dependent oxidoreductase